MITLVICLATFWAGGAIGYDKRRDAAPMT